MAVSSASTASTSASRRVPTSFRRSSRRSTATATGRDASPVPNPLFEQKDRVGRGDVPLHAVIVDRLRWWQTEPSAGDKTTARRPRGKGRRGCREPFGEVLGGGSTPHRLSGQPVRDRTTPAAKGGMGRQREEFRRSRPLSSGRGLHHDGNFLLNEGWLDGAGGSAAIRILDQAQQGQTRPTHFLVEHVRARLIRLGGP